MVVPRFAEGLEEPAPELPVALSKDRGNVRAYPEV